MCFVANLNWYSPMAENSFFLRNNNKLKKNLSRRLSVIAFYRRARLNFSWRRLSLAWVSNFLLSMSSKLNDFSASRFVFINRFYFWSFREVMLEEGNVAVDFVIKTWLKISLIKSLRDSGESSLRRIVARRDVNALIISESRFLCDFSVYWSK